MKKKRRLNYKRVGILILVLLLLSVGIYFGVKALTKPKKKTEEPVKVIDTLEEYGYTLDENETSYYKSLFNELKEVLKEEKVEEESYAKLISQLFLTDFFTLSNKTTKNDVGGIQFVYEEYQEDFQKYATESVYKYVESNLYGDRKQELPTVKEVNVEEIKQEEYEYFKEEDSKAYVVTLTITYNKDLGYQDSAILTLVHVDNKLEIVKMEETD